MEKKPKPEDYGLGAAGTRPPPSDSEAAAAYRRLIHREVMAERHRDFETALANWTYLYEDTR